MGSVRRIGTLATRAAKPGVSPVAVWVEYASAINPFFGTSSIPVNLE